MKLSVSLFNIFLYLLDLMDLILKQELNWKLMNTNLAESYLWILVSNQRNLHSEYIYTKNKHSFHSFCNNSTFNINDPHDEAICTFVLGLSHKKDVKKSLLTEKHPQNVKKVGNSLFAFSCESLVCLQKRVNCSFALSLFLK